VDILRGVLGTLTDFTVILHNKKFMAVDSYTGVPIPYYGFSIPVHSVGLKLEQNVVPSTNEFIGTFINETSMITFLTEVMELPDDHILVKNCAEFHGFKNLEKRFPKKTRQEFKVSVDKARESGGNASLNHPNQLGKNIKNLKRVFFFKKHGEEIKNGLYTIDTDQIMEESGKMNPVGFDFYGYTDFYERDVAAREQKKQNTLKIKQLAEIGEGVGIENLEKMILEAFPGASASSLSSPPKKKRKLGEMEGDSNRSEQGIIEENLGKNIQKIGQKIENKTAINLFDNELLDDDDCSDSSDLSDSESLPAPIPAKKLTSFTPPTNKKPASRNSPVKTRNNRK